MRRRFLSEVVGGAAAVTALFGVGTQLLADSESTTSSSPTGLKAVAVADARGTWTVKKNDGESVGIPSSGIRMTDSSVTWTFQR